VTQIRQFRWSDYDAVLAVWHAAGRDVLPRAELEVKLTRDPELFLVAEAAGGAEIERVGRFTVCRGGPGSRAATPGRAWAVIGR